MKLPLKKKLKNNSVPRAEKEISGKNLTFKKFSVVFTFLSYVGNPVTLYLYVKNIWLAV